MLKVSLKKRSQKLQQLLNDLKELDKQKVEVGCFASQGTHYSGMSFPALLAYHHFGNPERNIPSRPVNTIVAHNAKRSINTLDVRKELVNWKQSQQRVGAMGMFLDKVGQAVRDSGKELFGNSSALTPNARSTIKEKGFDAPLEDTGALKAAYAYKTSVDNVVKP